MYVRNAIHAPCGMSETDRLLARPDEFATEPQAVSAGICWRNWHRRELTAHDEGSFDPTIPCC